VCAAALCGSSRGTAGTGDIYSAACDAGGRTCACLRLCHRPVSRALAAGVTWTLVIASAPWAARGDHTSVIDAAGAIYVIGGGRFLGDHDDVWASTDGGSRPDSRLGVVREGVLRGYSGGYDKGTTGLMQEYTGVISVVIQGTPRLLCDTMGYTGNLGTRGLLGDTVGY
jgi:hypothetical protein